MKLFLALTSVSMLALSSLAHAEPSKAPAGDAPKATHGEHKMKEEHGMKGDWTPPASRAEAIDRTKEKLKKLESMSDDEWKKHHEERMKRHEDRKERREERRDDMKEKMKEKRGAKGGDAAEHSEQ
jgi:hypothetical protein